MDDAQARAMDSFHNVLNYDVLEKSDGFVRLAMTGDDCHRNQGDYIHGGVLMALMDIAGIMSGVGASNESRGAVTVNLNCNFLSAAFAEKVFADAKLVRKGRSIFFANCKVLDAATDKILATASGIYKYLD